MKTQLKSALGITIGLGNHKGGVGKSTNAVHLAAALGEMGFRCLVIDLDPTAGTTKLLGLNPDDYEGTLELLTTKGTTPLDVVVSELEEGEGELPEGVHLIPARTELADLDQKLEHIKFLDRFSLLKTPLKILKKNYDFILVDTPPQPGSTLLASAYAAVEWFLLCVNAEPLSVGTLMETLKDIGEVRKRLNKDLQVLGVVIGRVKRSSSYWKDIVELIDTHLPGRGFATQISDTVQLQRLSDQGICLFQHKRHTKSVAAEEYRAVAKEIQKRTMARDKFIQKANTLAQKNRVVNG